MFQVSPIVLTFVGFNVLGSALGWVEKLGDREGIGVGALELEGESVGFIETDGAIEMEGLHDGTGVGSLLIEGPMDGLWLSVGVEDGAADSEGVEDGRVDEEGAVVMDGPNEGICEGCTVGC